MKVKNIYLSGLTPKVSSKLVVIKSYSLACGRRWLLRTHAKPML